MTPSEQVRSLYERFPQPRTFEEDVAAHLQTGYVISTPRAFIMGRGILSTAPHDLIANPWHRFEYQDTWLVWAASSESVKTFLTFVPHPLSWVAFARRDRPIKFYPFEKLCAQLTRF